MKHSNGIQGRSCKKKSSRKKADQKKNRAENKVEQEKVEQTPKILEPMGANLLDFFFLLNFFLVHIFSAPLFFQMPYRVISDMLSVIPTTHECLQAKISCYLSVLFMCIECRHPNIKSRDIRKFQVLTSQTWDFVMTQSTL